MTYQQPNRDISIIDLGLIGYQEAWDFQEKMFAELLALKKENRDATNPVNVPNYLILCEHPPVYTLGKSGKEENLLLSKEELEQIGATYFKINRGGDITHHGPGQLVVYPLLDLENFFTDIHLYLRKLEEAVIQTLFTLGIQAGRYPGYTGVWIQPEDSSARKICAMGVKCSRWVTMHGIALNVNNDLSYFKHIIPCGIEDKAVTSIQKELPGFPISMELVKQLFLKNFEKEFDAHLLNNQ
jgi:lipoyl(octanoyl) transferase